MPADLRFSLFFAFVIFLLVQYIFLCVMFLFCAKSFSFQQHQLQIAKSMNLQLKKEVRTKGFTTDTIHPTTVVYHA